MSEKRGKTGQNGGILAGFVGLSGLIFWIFSVINMGGRREKTAIHNLSKGGMTDVREGE